MNAPRFESVPNNIGLFRCLADGLHIGFVRMASADEWIARTPGSAEEAADICSFPARDAAARWLIRMSYQEVFRSKSA